MTSIIPFDEFAFIVVPELQFLELLSLADGAEIDLHNWFLDVLDVSLIEWVLFEGLS